MEAVASIVEVMDEFDAVIRDNKFVVCDFSAKWCGPCQFIGPEFDTVSDSPDVTDVVFIKVDVDDNQATATACGIQCMPTFQFFKNGKKVEQFEGADKEKLLKIIEKFRE